MSVRPRRTLYRRHTVAESVYQKVKLGRRVIDPVSSSMNPARLPVSASSTSSGDPWCGCITRVRYLTWIFSLLCTLATSTAFAFEKKAEFWFSGIIWTGISAKPPTFSEKIFQFDSSVPPNYQITHGDVYDITRTICETTINEEVNAHRPLGSYVSFETEMTELNRCSLFGITVSGNRQPITNTFYTPIIVTRNSGFDQPGLKAGKPKQCVGNPCDPLSGNKYESAVDFDGPGTGLPFVRHYSSLSRLVDEGMGPGWTHGYSNRMTTTATKRIVLDDGRGVELYAAGSGTWTPVSDDDFVVSASATDYLVNFDTGEQWIFDDLGRLKSKQDINGRLTTIVWTTSGATETQTITGPYGHTLTLDYTGGRLTQATDANGDSFSYQYDTSPEERLVSVIDPLGQVRSYHYEVADRPGLLTGITDENGDRYATFDYDSNGLVSLSEHAVSENSGGQEAVTLNYDAATDTNTVTDAAGHVRTYEYQEIRGRRWLEKQTFPDGKSRVWTRDPETDRVTRIRDENYNRTDSVYNATGQRTQVIEAQGTGKERITTWEYQSPDSDIVTKITRPSVAAGNLATTEFTYNDPNHPYLPTLIKQTGFTAGGTALNPRYTEMTYSQSGQVTSVDVSGKNSLDRLILKYHECATGNECGQLEWVTNTFGHTTYYDLYDGAGRLLEMKDPNELVTGYTYDGRGRVLTRTQQSPTGQARTTTYVYDSLGQLTSVTDPKGLVYEYVYDAAHDLQEVWTKKVDGTVYARVEYDYDSRGNRVAERVYNAGGGLATDQSMVYDLRNRLADIEAAITGSTASLTQRVYDAVGNLTEETDPNQSAIEQGGGNPLIEEHRYDALNRLFKTIDELGGVTQMWYTVADDIAQVRAPNGATTVYETDDFGNRTKEISPDRGTTTYTYKVWGDIQSQLDARGQQVNYIYDDLKRLKTIGYGTSDNINFTYDNCTGGIDRVCKVVDKSGVTNYQYDAFGNVTRTERRIDGVWYNTDYTYDAQDQLSTVTYPSGRRMTYLRDKAGRVFRVKQKIGGVETDVITGRGYRGDHQFITQTLGNGLKETRKYDLQGRMYELKLADGGTTVYFRHFEYDASGNVTARKVDATLNNPVYDGSFGYDVLDRLTSEDHGTQWLSPVSGEPVLYPTTFGYTDPDGTGWKANNGNRRQMTRDGSTTNLSYTNNSNRLTNDGSQGLIYDAAGNQTGRGTESWVYDPRGLISQYRQNGSTVAAYTYDYRSLRSKKALTGAETIVYLHDLQGQLIAEYEDGSLKREYVWLDGAPLAQIDAAAGGDSITWLTTDHLFTPRLGTDSAKEPVWQWDSYAFGETDPFLPTGSSGTLSIVNLRFPGQYFDGESDRYYNWHRYYAPNTGRYIASDLIGLSGGLNTFAYGADNPLRFIDPEGLEYKAPGEFGHGSLSIDDQCEIGGWIVDIPGDETDSGGTLKSIPDKSDVDFFFTNGQWYKIKHGEVKLRCSCGQTEVVPGSLLTIVYPVSNPPPFWKWRDGNEPQIYINDQQNPDLPGRPVPYLD